MADLTGQSIGRYHIVEKLGEGGMAVVYKAYDTRLEREVAIKVIRTELFGEAILAPLLKRFEREAKALARMQHPHIVPVHDYGEFEQTPYLVMDYLPGGTLKAQTGKSLPYPQAARLLAPIARALEYAHREGIIHRDIKPANILMTRSGAPMLTDFGIAKILESEQTTQLTGTGMSIGTPEYMSPEQWTGEVSPKVDIYALGVIFFELVTGRRPFTADTPAAILVKVTVDPLPRPRDFTPDLPEEVEQVLFKALAKQPDSRYATMGDFASALERLANAAEKVQPQPFVPGDRPATTQTPPPQTAQTTSPTPIPLVATKPPAQTKPPTPGRQAPARQPTQAVSEQALKSNLGLKYPQAAQPAKPKRRNWLRGCAVVILWILGIMAILSWINYWKQPAADRSTNPDENPTAAPIALPDETQADIHPTSVGNTSPIPYNWQTVSTTRYYHHAAGFAEYDGFVYVIGGFDGAQLIREVEYAPVTADGKIGPWKLTSPLVMPSYTTAAVAAQGHLYLVGGRPELPPVWSNMVQVADIQPDGSLSAWRLTSPMILERDNHGAVVIGNYIYAIGGSPNWADQSSVEYAQIKSDGSLGAWQYTTSMNSIRKAVVAVAFEQCIYALGGGMGDLSSPSETVERSCANADGSLGDWEYQKSMTQSRAYAAAVVAQDKIIVMGGNVSSTLLDSVEMTEIRANGTLEGWKIAPSLESSRLGAGSVVFGDYIYLIGGNKDVPDNLTYDVDRASLAVANEP